MNVFEFEKYTKDSYLAYSVMTLAERALPYVQDGFKPVHRRILYAMAKLNMTSTGAHKKSARVVGDVIGKYHPHGDQSVYDAMVKMVQPWYLRYPLIDGQGNFGSRDGDSQAAMRYTEARTTPLADAILNEINAGAIDYKDNYDGSTKEPRFLPAPLPIDLMNGSYGIAVAMTSNIPSHNIGEVVDATIAYIKNNDITIEEIMDIIQGPDLPTGGQIISSKEEILKAYETGDGRLKVRCRWVKEELAKNQWRILVTELPQDLSAQKITVLVEQASTYEPEKKKGGKEEKVNPKLLELKNFIKNNIERLEDISAAEDSASGRIKILIEPKSCKQDPEEFMAAVITMLGMETTLSIKLNAVSLDKLPRTRSIKDLIADWVQFRRETVTKRTRTRLGKVIERLELVLGRLKIMDILDEVIDIIRTHEEPKEELMRRFELTERQAEDILEIRLKELRKLEEYKLLDEKSKLEKEQAELEALLESPRKMNNLLIKEITSTAEPFLDARRTLIKTEESISKSAVTATPSEPITVFVTKEGWLMGRKGAVEETPDSSLKAGDSFVHSFQTKLDKTIIVLGESGRSYCFPATSLAFGKSGTVHLNTLITANGDKPFAFIPYEEGERYLLAQSEGYGFVVKSENLFTKQKAGKECFKMENFPSAKISVAMKLDSRPMINIWTNQGRLLQFYAEEINEYPKSQGICLIKLADNEKVDGYELSNSGEFIYKGKVKKLDVSFFKKRAAAPKKV